MVTKWFGGDQQSQHRVPSTLQGGWALGGLEGTSMPCSSRGWTGPGICADPCGHRVPHPQAGLCSQCCQTAQSWGLLLVTLVPDKLLMRTGDAQIQFFLCGSVRLLFSKCISTHVSASPCFPCPFWFILASTSDPGSPRSFFPCKRGPGMAERAGMSSSPFTLPKAHLPIHCTPWEQCSDPEAFTDTSPWVNYLICASADS